MKIYSVRNITNLVSHDVVYEWEDYASKLLNARIICCNRVERKLGRLLCPHYKKKLIYRNDNEPILFFCMNINELIACSFFRKDIIPIMLDLPYNDIHMYVSMCRDLPVFWVTAYETYMIMRNQYNLDNAEYIPLFISDDLFDENKLYGQRDIDIIQIGRRNSVLHQFALQYCSKHRDCNYVYRELCGEGFRYISTISGDLGSKMKRDEYIGMLLKSAVSLVSTPAMDDSRIFGGGIDFFTPRFYESLGAGCGIVARFSDIKEAEIIGIKRVCDSIKDYQQFEDRVSELLNLSNEERVRRSREFVHNNSAYFRINSIISTLNERIKRFD